MIETNLSTGASGTLPDDPVTSYAEAVSEPEKNVVNQQKEEL